VDDAFDVRAASDGLFPAAVTITRASESDSTSRQ
jgi:hypothetical protein